MLYPTPQYKEFAHKHVLRRLVTGTDNIEAGEWCVFNTGLVEAGDINNHFIHSGWFSNSTFFSINPDGDPDVDVTIYLDADLKVYFEEEPTYLKRFDTKYQYLGTVERHFFYPPRKITSKEDFDKFLPFYTEYESTFELSQNDPRYWWFKNQDLSDDRFWVKRERARMLLPAHFGKVRKIPNFLASPTEALRTMFEAQPKIYTDLFPYMSHTQPGMLAYTPEDDNKREFDRQVIIKPGRFMRKTYPDITDADMRDVTSTTFNSGDLTLSYAKTSEEFDDVYARGPSTCMTKSVDFYDDARWTGMRPIAVLANGNIEVAYIELPNGTIPARTLINRRHKTYVKIYDNNDALEDACSLLEKLLNDNGYLQCNDTLIGESFDRIESDYGDIVCPYLDPHNLGVEVHDEKITIVEEGYGDGQPNYSTGALDLRKLQNCDHCEEDYDVEDTEFEETFDLESVCEHCIHDYFVYAHAQQTYRDYIHIDQAVEVNGEYYHVDYLEDNDIHYCEVSEEYCHESDMEVHAVTGELVNVNYLYYVENKEAFYFRNEVVCDYQGNFIVSEEARCVDGKYYHVDEILPMNVIFETQHTVTGSQAPQHI